ncbi:hypothetical protein A6V36_32510 [Paraburkholderia ginsengiterrae]|uniref:Tetratricopeptide repeat protein n=2 Tax=Paraburkholderia ginsengiterrae TaxID=1462993 RepID=A0A1A9N5K5_9BURK|nr:hypothetical protein A6V37_30490 [Paraburkholderia ginsengiterrae]OAJ57010.1 hypothetical protein A6V36_32510 [Paraburkholderia ginsengiterrae]
MRYLPRQLTRPRSLLSALALAILSSGCFAASTPDSCSPALSEVDVISGFKIRADCGFPIQTLTHLTTGLNRVAREVGLSAAQRVSLARATNVMSTAVVAQSRRASASADVAFGHIEPLLENLAQEIKARPDTDPVAEARKWNARYGNLLRRSTIARSSDPLESQIAAALDRFDLDAASRLLTTLLAGKQDATQAFAEHCYDAAVIELLRFSPARALPCLEKAYALQPDDPDIASDLADTLQAQSELERAQAVDEALLRRYRTLAQEKPATYQPLVARTLDQLGSLYIGLQRPTEAEAAYLHALEIDWALARENPAAYGPHVAEALDHLGALYRDTQRLKDATDAYREALDIDRALAQRDSAAYTPDVATTLDDLGILYSATQRTGDAEQVYRKALEIQRALVRDNPARWRPTLAQTLNNLGNLYSATQRYPDAEHVYREALTIRRQLAHESPALYEPDMARTLGNLGVLYRATQRPGEAQRADQQALRIYRQLARTNPAAWQADEARTLNNLGVLFSRTRRPGEAEVAYREALGLYRSLSRENPNAYRQDEARTLGNLGELLSQTQRPREAMEAKREAARLLGATDTP